MGRAIRLKSITLVVSLTILLIAVIIGLIAYNSRPLEKCSAFVTVFHPTVILDAGHGGVDGGAVSLNGTEEAPINLSITKKTRDIMAFVGINAILTRSDGQSLNYATNKTTRENKNADLRARLEFAKLNADCDFLSIHLNKFEQSKYFGAQVFYSLGNESSVLLAETLQNSLIEYLDSSNTRKAKQSPDSVYLMKNIASPAVTIECGFLSNPEEELKLRSDEYQTHIALAITKGYIDYIKER